ncbi:MAG: BatA domain-containing protein, partial [Planctomycetota bacterium]
MFAWMLNPLMLGLGGLAVGVPILIHLLNKRRYRIVDWAAMDFLLEADKKNRKRVQLENFLILALRCLAMLLLGLLLARPFLPSAVTSILGQKEQFERVVLVDDSLSQRVLVDNVPALDNAKNKLKELLTDLAQSDSSDDWVTVFLTSNTEQPILANEPVTRGTLPTLIDAVDGIDGADGAADYGLSLTQVKQYVAGQRDSISRIVYLLTDLRQRDWLPEAGQSAETAPNRLVQDLGKEATQGFVVDVGSTSDQNIGVTDVRSQDLLVANRIVRFEVDLASYAREPISNLRVSLQIDEQPPIIETLDQLPAGGKETVTFRYLFQPIAGARKGVDESVAT